MSLPRNAIHVQYKQPDNESQAAHIYRGREILCTVLIELQDNGQYKIQREGTDDIPFYSNSPVEALRIADGYLAGFMSGYDQGDEHGKANPRHDWPDADRRADDRCLRCGHRITAPQSKHRD